MNFDALRGRATLLVDDEAFFLSSVVEGLRAAAPGLEVLTASNGVEALEVLARRSVDAVVTDIKMPTLDGFGLIAEIAARKLDVSIVVMTAFAPPSQRQREDLPPVVEYIEKPIDFSQLVQTLAEIMRERANSTPTLTPNSTRGPSAPQKDPIMDNTKQSLSNIAEIVGTLGAALVDFESGMTLGTIGSGINLEVAAAGNMEVMRAKHRVMKELGIRGGIEDILITLETQYHIIRPIGNALFLYLALNRKEANLAMARRKLASVAAELEVS